MVSPSALARDPDSDIPVFVLSEYDESREVVSSPSDVETEFGIPSLDHLVHTERCFYNLSRSRALSRAVRLANAMYTLFSEHSFDVTLGSRGPEIHRLLSYYLTNDIGGTPVWIGFSPFEDTVSLTSSLNGSWDSYRTVPYEEIPEAERADTERHVEQFRDEQRFYAHEAKDKPPKTQQLKATMGDVIDRDRPGRVRDQVKQRVTRRLCGIVNSRQHPPLERSRRRCQERPYVFYPLQYPIESRLTVYSPQFFRQEFLAEYVRRILPSDIELFIKPHPSHPGWPSPERLYRYRNMEGTTVLNPGLNSHYVVKHSEGVLVTNNTVGFEAIYHNKPVFAAGNAFYSGVPASIPIRELDDAPAKIARNVSTEIDEREVISSVYSLREASYNGNWPLRRDDDAEILADSTVAFLESEGVST